MAKSELTSLDYLKKILNSRVYEVVRETPLEYAPKLSEETGNRVFLKREDLQPVHSFKCRGAYEKIVRLSPEERARGLIAASAGNHAQGVALAAQTLGVEATIVVPNTTPDIKCRSIEGLGAQLIKHGNGFDDAYEHARELERERGLVFIHPYDDPDVIAGQGTIAMELAKQHPDPIDAVFIAVGGGGLIAGMAAYLKQLRPETRVIGVEPTDAASMKRSLEAGAPQVLDKVGQLADGVATRTVGAETFRLAREFVDEVITVTPDGICSAVKAVFENCRAILEPAGALSYEGLRTYADREGWRGKNLVAIACGANVNFDRIGHIVERANLGHHHEALYAVTIPEKKGAFRRFCSLLGNRSITEFNYRLDDSDAAHIFVGVRTRNEDDAHDLQLAWETEGYAVAELTDNELAKVHVRHMVGGRSPKLEHERLYRCMFPERPGALGAFLDKMGDRYNISLFHYRNHGADFGRVLLGVQVEPAHVEDFERRLDELGYEFDSECDNPVYHLFLRSNR